LIGAKRIRRVPLTTATKPRVERQEDQEKQLPTDETRLLARPVALAQRLDSPVREKRRAI
jgi:hypothetical protein